MIPRAILASSSLIPQVVYAPDAYARSPRRWPCALMCHSHSYYCVIFHCSAHFESLSTVQEWHHVLDYVHDVFKNSLRVPVQFFARLSGIFCSGFLVSCFLFHFPALHFLFRNSFFFLFHFQHISPLSGGNAGSGLSRSSGRLRDTRADPPFPISDLMRNFGAYLLSRQLAAMRIKGDRTSVWDVRFWRNCDAALGARKKKWSDWGGPGAFNCRCV